MRRPGIARVVIGLLTVLGAFCSEAYADQGEALMGAAQKGDLKLVQDLLEKGAEVNAGDEHGRTALMAASEEGRLDVVKLLQEQGADVNARDETGVTAVMKACANGHLGVVKELLKGGTNVNTKDYEGATPLMWASQYGHAEVVRLLLEKGAGVNVKDYDGVTALKAASARHHCAVADLLLKSGAIITGPISESPTLVKMLAQPMKTFKGHKDIIHKLGKPKSVDVKKVPGKGPSSGLDSIERLEFPGADFLIQKVDKSNREFIIKLVLTKQQKALKLPVTLGASRDFALSQLGQPSHDCGDTIVYSGNYSELKFRLKDSRISRIEWLYDLD
jgi:hypothetical protein